MTKPSLDLLRSMTDEHVLRALMQHERATRAQIAATTGISKPTISESVRRLTEAGLLMDTGERTTGRGGVGSYYSLSEDVGVALVVDIAPSGVTGEAVNAFGTTVARASVPLDRSAGEARTARALRKVTKEIGGAARTAVVSAADPVDRRTGALVHLPDAPFLVGSLDPVAVMRPLVDGPVLVDNDVNWAARAESDSGCAQGVRDFVYLHLGEGLGFAVISDGEVRRGHRGLAGEIAHVSTTGPDGTAMPLTEVFAALGLRQPSSTAIDTVALRAASAEHRESIARAVCGVLMAAVSLVDPEIAVIGGEWGPDLAENIDRHQGTRKVPLVKAQIRDPAMTGARTHAVQELRSAIVSRSGR
ncbi:ROK family transcriptional regulator [Kibdelosporangium aridum]|uniref:Sugar kinase of the NBD/HSP70 family, may contain an N-terminal HTH domain n=1 Tax=Kibdelosporangium aridum TaxID=2030 RepID=A0A1W2FQJ5_KIBAR|nr:ROK family transcriptional regulator [Kibdelosporangium aridum]SMD24044.1 Sugar kinase of the NBD/HSP70 family, may contain an N-terminal HTH domain [Kibdelosporangium aridum]